MTHLSLDRRAMLGASIGAAGLMATGAPIAASADAPLLLSPRRSELLADGWRFHMGHAADP
jgi:beta-galactosidase